MGTPVVANAIAGGQASVGSPLLQPSMLVPAPFVPASVQSADVQAVPRRVYSPVHAMLPCPPPVNMAPALWLADVPYPPQRDALPPAHTPVTPSAAENTQVSEQLASPPLSAMA